MLAIADKNQKDVEKQRECREKIRVSAEQLSSLMNDVLDISKLESGAFSFAEESFNICDVLDNCISILYPQTEELGIHLEERKMNLCHTNLVGMKVLLVEDNAINYEIVKYMLEDAGAVVEIAENVPIIVLSANLFEKDVEKAKEAGANEHLTKPVDMESLFKVMWRLKRK